MCAIYKKELRAYLTSMTGYIFMAVLLAVTSLYYVCLLYTSHFQGEKKGEHKLCQIR